VRVLAKRIKSNGVHYTPPQLADFLAAATLRAHEQRDGVVRVLDPACGDGELLAALYRAAPHGTRSRLLLCGYETDPSAVRRAHQRLEGLGASGVEIRHGDFLELVAASHVHQEPGGHLFADPSEPSPSAKADIVIANPPYVRTQVLGAERAQELALSFGLSGRVDLYHAFVAAVCVTLKRGGVLGLLTSNRFMVVQSGATTRSLLRQSFELREVYDLGDTKLFAAAVLPAVLVGVRADSPASQSDCEFVRVYEQRGADECVATPSVPSVLEALRIGTTGAVRTPTGTFWIQRGRLRAGRSPEAPWALASDSGDSWLCQVYSRRRRVFGDLGSIRVGIKTTADAVFIREDWRSLPRELQPEDVLLRPLVTHHVRARWAIKDASSLRRRVLYPHAQDGDRKVPVNLDEYPRAKAYLEMHRSKLESRRYVIEAGRQWFEIWVPQQPSDWPYPRVVFPDIAEHPRFFLDRTGAVVNGDCYWFRPRPGFDENWLLLVLAVANSTFIARYYDTRFHNKLYAGRRRFMTQYVREFPLPDVADEVAQRIVSRVRVLVEGNTTEDTGEVERHIDSMVYESFGVAEKGARERDLEL
jgi:adenine-specific DNA-methyltransferase